ncbi:MAG: beta-ketoacyl synthase [Bacteroidetes bacterium]|nr:beta-ketoacyl synthase [Bacteroidota bacterium]
MAAIKPVYAIATNITSSLGLNTQSHWKAVEQGTTAIKQYNDAAYSKSPFYSSKIDASQWQYIQAQAKYIKPLSTFEQLALFSAKAALGECNDELNADDTVVILSTTKGNIEWLDMMPDERIQIAASAEIIADVLGFNKHKPIIVSHACVSGVLATTYAMRLLQAGRYKNAVVIGCDRFTQFVLNGFQSFHAIADEPCRPFDADRKGINLGEAGATIILSSEPGDNPLAKIVAGASSNDANHISGPSRTGEELALAINKTLKEANVPSSQIDMLSAHGTGTPYNDEMEAKAFGLCGLDTRPMHSFKGYTGHTLGAAGVMESAVIIEAIRNQQLIPSLGYQNNGVSVALNITTQLQNTAINYVLKTASGFGGCNATALWAKV